MLGNLSSRTGSSMTRESRGNIVCEAPEEQGREGRAVGPVHIRVWRQTRVSAGWPPTHETSCVYPGPLNPNTERVQHCPQFGNPTLAPSVSQGADAQDACACRPFRPRIQGGPTPSARQQRGLGRPSPLPVRRAEPLTQLTPGRSSDLERPVTYFPLLLFLEVLVSMPNSAERLSEKKKREKMGRRRERTKGRRGKGGAAAHQIALTVARTRTGAKHGSLHPHRACPT